MTGKRMLEAVDGEPAQALCSRMLPSVIGGAGGCSFQFGRTVTDLGYPSLPRAGLLC